jgi:excisionase family DNA binding protein
MPIEADITLPMERWSSVEEVTEHLGVGRDTIYRWIERKGLPAHRIGRLWKFKLSEVDSWVRAQIAPSGRKVAEG